MPTPRPSLLRRGLLLAAFCSFPTVAAGQTGAELVRRMQASAAERMAGIDNVTVLQEMAGTPMTSYMERREVGGSKVLVPVSVTMDGRTVPMPSVEGAGNPADLLQEAWADRFAIVGHEKVDEHPVTVLELTDFEGMPMTRVRANENVLAQTRPISWRFFLDESDMVIRKMEMQSEVTSGTGVDTLTITMIEDEYRTVNGFFLATRTRMITSGMPGMDVEQTRAELERMKATVDRLPEDRRDMMQKVIAQLENRVANGGAMVVTVTDVKVNAGPPGG